ncbi:SusC/RagA family TonB-linked outer membrane protein [Parapedobacter soli]|uniref:SusC/RagA family TonB-linked outer membrane protein n=1 Tax=Parapedobacter soli TaxID=416955 RepID=UPI0021C96FA5|nr:SusC/RagA family TonB-linked outer membrane protein [Parapedobacter soli]
MKQKLLCFFMLGVLLIGSAYAQDRRISGRVTSSDDGEPIAGVSVLAVGASVASQTDGLGTFSITVPSTVKALEFRYLGYVSQTVNIESSDYVTVALGTDATTLEEVVVTGVGVATERKRVAIAVESLDASDLPQAPQGSLDQALVGKIAGAQISATSGQPGQQASILLRGINTLQGTQPMILVDGVQINAGGSTIGSDQNVSSRLSDLDLANVERVEVIQGAAAGTIYGAQGANGVIQIFTKRGKRGQRPSITINSRASFDNALRGNLDFAKKHRYNVDAQGYILDASGNRIVRDDNGGWSIPGNPTIDGELKNDKPYMEQTYDHLGQLFISNALTHNTNVSIAGGGDAIDYAVTLSHLNQQSIVYGKNKRYNVSTNLGAELFKNFTVRSITQLVHGNNTTGGVTGANNIYSGIGSASLAKPYWDLTFKNADGHYVADPENSNSVNPFYTQQFNPLTGVTNRIVQNFNLNYKFERFLELDYKYGIDNTRFDYTDFVKYQEDVQTPGAKIPSTTGALMHRNDNDTYQNSLLSAFIRTDFQKDFGSDLPIQTSTHLAFDWRKTDESRITAQASGFAAFPPYTLRSGDEQSVDEFIGEFITYGYLVNQRIDYGSLFGVSGGLRVDYASTFGGADFKPFVFPRADAYFNVADLINSSSLYELKLRGAYGAAGTQPDFYARQITLGQGNIGTSGFLALESTARNPNLQVQSSYETEFGFDLGARLSNGDWFKRLTLNTTYWFRTSENVIRTIDLPPSSGATGIFDNAITLKSDGIQIALDLDVLDKPNVNWTFGTRFGASKTVVDQISNGKDIILGSGGSGQFVLREGAQVSTFFGYKPLSSIDETNADGERYIPEAQAGDFEVVNGIVVNKSTKAVRFTSENVEIGNPTPLFTATFLNNLTLYKNLNVGFQLDWYFGNDIYNQTKQWLYRDYLHADLDKAITVNGQSGAYVNYYNSLYNTNQNNAYFVEDGSFLRLRDLTISYNFTDLLKNTNVFKNLQLSVTGRNLFTITNYTGIDPEASASFNSATRRGLDLHSFPNVRSVQFGVMLGL